MKKVKKQSEKRAKVYVLRHLLCLNMKNNVTSQETSKRSHNKFKMGLIFICVVCNRCLYRKSVLMFYENKYNMTTVYFNRICSMMDVNISAKHAIISFKKRKNTMSGSM